MRQEGSQAGRERVDGQDERDRQGVSEREGSSKMVCVLALVTGAHWAGLNEKMQAWEMQAAPLLCAVRSFDHTFFLSVRGVLEPLRELRMCASACICQAACLFVSSFTATHICFCLCCGLYVWLIQSTISCCLCSYSFRKSSLNMSS